jgi:uncharacterized protein (TIGR03086 family)
MPDRTVPALSTDELIALGRDREAVASATRDSASRPAHHGPPATTAPGGTMHAPDQLDALMPLLQEIVAQISADQLDDPTPCAHFTVAGVLEHMIAGAAAFAPAFRGEPVPPADSSGADDVTDRWRRAMSDLQDAVHSDGALDRTIAAPFGDVPGAAFACFVVFDGLVHGWDLATATAQPYAPPDSLVREVDDFVRQVLTPAMRDGDTFAAEASAPADASPLERLVAFSGRQLPTNRSAP